MLKYSSTPKSFWKFFHVHVLKSLNSTPASKLTDSHVVKILWLLPIFISDKIHFKMFQHKLSLKWPQQISNFQKALESFKAHVSEYVFFLYMSQRTLYLFIYTIFYIHQSSSNDMALHFRTNMPMQLWSAKENFIQCTNLFCQQQVTTLISCFRI